MNKTLAAIHLKQWDSLWQRYNAIGATLQCKLMIIEARLENAGYTHNEIEHQKALFRMAYKEIHGE
jgi:hypothetical protein